MLEEGRPLVLAHRGAAREHGTCGLETLVHRRVQLRCREGSRELVDGALGRCKAFPERRAVLAEQLPRHRRIAGREHLTNGFEGHVKLTEPPNDRRVRELRDRVRPVPRRRVDLSRHEQAGFVVRAQRLDGQPRSSGELADAQQIAGHVRHPLRSPRGRVKRCVRTVPPVRR
jgi:hypothetical protein